MLKQSTLILAETSDDYSKFIDTIYQNFTAVRIMSQEDAFIKEMNEVFMNCSSSDPHLLILFVEYPFLNTISDYLSSIPNPLNFILISFYDKDFVPKSYTHLFELINIHSNLFNSHHFIHKLNAEISHKTNILTLQNEVREFYKIGKSLSSEKDTVKLLEMIIDSSIAMTSSDAGTIYLVLDKESEKWSSIKNAEFNNKLLKFVIAKNLSMDVNKLETFISPITEQSIFGYTVITGNSVRIDNAYDIPQNLNYRHNKSFDNNIGYKTKSILSIPMKDHEDKVMGVIQLINKKKQKQEKIDYTDPNALSNIICYDCNDELIMESLAGQATVALENNLLYTEMNELLELYKKQNTQLEYLSTKILKAHEEERKRIAREIHDGPAQSVANLSLRLELCKKFFQINDYDRLVTGMDELNTSIRSSVKDIRTIIYDLKPSYLEDGLIKALENHLNMFKDHTGITFNFHVTGSDSGIEYYLVSTIYRIVQEALSNTTKYAQAKNVTIDLEICDRSLSLIIIDDGKGFDTSDVISKKPHKLEGGYGLEGMQERVELVRGSLEIKSAPSKGTRIIVKIPLTQE